MLITVLITGITYVSHLLNSSVNQSKKNTSAAISNSVLSAQITPLASSSKSQSSAKVETPKPASHFPVRPITELTAQLTAQANSTENGSAFFKKDGHASIITLNLQNISPHTKELIQIKSGNCSELKTPLYSLGSLKNSQFSSKINVDLQTLALQLPASIVVYKIAAHKRQIVSCGNIVIAS